MRGFVLVVVALVAAGCSAPAPQTGPPQETPGIITDPTMGLNQTGAHIHDYWQGQPQLQIIGPEAPADESGLGPGFASAESSVRLFQPSSGHVVPQGTAAVAVTVSWTDSPDGLDSYGEVSLWVKTAAQNETTRLGPTDNGQAHTIPTTLADADLPHQLLSAWTFEIRMSPPPGLHLRFKGDIAVEATAVRGLDLPVFPAHPDAWNGATEIGLVQASGQLAYWEDTTDGGSNGFGPPIVYSPISGAIVPANASHVAVQLTWTGPVALDVWYHDATSRTMMVATPTTTASGAATYELPVVPGYDGPYAKQSQWEFTVKPATTGPLRTAWFAEYTLAAQAVRATP